MKRGFETNRIALAVASLIAIMAIFGAVLIISGRTVLVSGKAAATGPTMPNYLQPRNMQSSTFPYYMMPTIKEDSPCSILQCFKGEQPLFLEYDITAFPESYALCVCAEIAQGKAFYHDWEIKRIRTQRKY